MQREQLPGVAIKTFEYYYNQLAAGQSGLIPEDALVPVASLPDAETFSADLAERGRAVLPQTILLKLNGGLGTSMGLNKAKSLLMVRDGLSFLDIIAHQAERAGVPLILMNSFNTRADSLRALEKYGHLQSEIPLDFLQHKIPKVTEAGLTPVEWPADPSLEWCPPGHGDIYTALVTSGLLDMLLEQGYPYAFVANADNLGAVLDPAILGYFAQEALPFMMEVADRTTADRKGGHLAQRPDGQLILREIAQTPAEDMEQFQDITRHKYFNTNNLWLNLPALKAVLAANHYILGLPMIRNKKTVDPRDDTSTPVYQLETAMGSAIGVFKGAGAVRVPRSRFAPVKTTDDLLVVRSDAYVLTKDYQVQLNPERQLGNPVVKLDPKFYRLIDELEARFPYGSPSLIECEQLEVRGDFKFGRNISLQGSILLTNESDGQQVIADNSVLIGDEKIGD